MVAVYVVFGPPAIPDGTVNVTLRVKFPATPCKDAVLRENVPNLLTPLREPVPSAVVPVNALPAKVNWLTPVTFPVVEPLTVTSSAPAPPPLSVQRGARGAPHT